MTYFFSIILNYVDVFCSSETQLFGNGPYFKSIKRITKREFFLCAAILVDLLNWTRFDLVYFVSRFLCLPLDIPWLCYQD